MKTALVAGATGLIGTSLIRMLLESQAYDQVHILVRRKMELVHPKLNQHVLNFDELPQQNFDFKVDDAYCTLGTTIAKAGSQDAFIKVDHTYVVDFAKAALSLGASGFFVVSSMGANPSSSIFYSRVKGQMEEELKSIGFPRLGIFRPSLLLGPRVEKRAAERFSGWMMTALDFMVPRKYKTIHVDKVAKKMIEKALLEENGIYTFDSGQLQ